MQKTGNIKAHYVSLLAEETKTETETTSALTNVHYVLTYELGERELTEKQLLAYDPARPGDIILCFSLSFSNTYTHSYMHAHTHAHTQKSKRKLRKNKKIQIF